MSEWKVYKLGEIAEIRREGFTPNSNEVLPYIGLEHIEPKSLRLNSIGSSQDISSQKSKFYTGDILYGKLRPYFQKVYYSSIYGVCSTDIFVIKSRGVINSKFLFYLLASDEFTSLANLGSTGTRMPRADWKHLSNTIWNIPSLPTQTAIAEVLSSLDDKIELNNKINQELEALAQTLFKQWFKDFEFPNENGEPYKSSGGEMVESELGEIPMGWDVVELSNLLTVKYGKDHKHLSDGIYPLYGSGGIMRYVEKPLYQHNSILIPRKGTLSNLFYLEEPFWSVDTMFYTEIHNPIFGKYLFHCIKALDIASMNVGSAVPSMTTKVLNELKILNPSDLVIQEFDTALSAFHNSINQNKKETEDLTNLRNTLLPKLISGELEINEISN